MTRLVQYSRKIALVLVLSIVSLLSIELLLRVTFGLGAAPLYMRHPSIEYIYQPNQDLIRFGRHFKTNNYGMRSDNLDSDKHSAEYRIAVFGDSLVNGGMRLDHDDLATTIAQTSLDDRYENVQIRIANISMGSWGPANYLAFVEEHGVFNADIAILVLSSHDFYDVPTYGKLDQCTERTEQPLTAITDVMYCYVLPTVAPPITQNTSSISPNRNNSAASLLKFLRLFRESDIDVHVIQHWDQTEIVRNRPHSGHREIRLIANQYAASVTQLGQLLKQSNVDIHYLYFDNIHFNERGQRALADVILKIVTNSGQFSIDSIKIENK